MPECIDLSFFDHMPNSAFAGVSPKEAKAIILEHMDVKLSSKKLYLLEIRPLRTYGGGERLFHLLTTDIDYSPVTIPSERHEVGSASLDSLKTTEHVELRMTTFDNKNGDVKRWFDNQAGKVANSDGTVGLPSDYLVEIRILHDYFSDSMNKSGYENNYLMRPVSSEYGLSREEGGKQKLNLVFTQFDTQMSP